MDEKHVYEAPEAEALSFCQEGNFCGTLRPTSPVTFGSSSDEDYFGEETEW